MELAIKLIFILLAICLANKLVHAEPIFYNDTSLVLRNFFEDFDPTGIDEAASKFMIFRPSDMSFWGIASYLLNFINIEVIPITGPQLSNYELCSYLLLDKRKNYTIIKPKSQTSLNSIMATVDIKMPFTPVLAKDIKFSDKDFCLAVSKKDYGLGINLLPPFPCMPDVNKCSITLLGASLSIDGNLNYIPGNSPAVTIFDGMREQFVEPKGNFAMFFHLGIPAQKPNNLLFVPFDIDDGFHFKLGIKVTALAQFHSNQNLIFINSDTTQLDLFYKKTNLFSSRLNMKVSGTIRDSVTDTLRLCQPSGVFMNVYLSTNKESKGFDFVKFGTQIWSGLFGAGLANFRGKFDMGVYANFRQFNAFFNGFFLRGRVELELFWIFKTVVDMEVQYVHTRELQRRLASMNQPMCGAYELTTVTKFLFDKYTRRNELLPYDGLVGGLDGGWNRLFGSDNMYLVGHFDAVFGLRLPILDVFIIKQTLRGYYITPNPFKRHLQQYLEITAYADILNFVGVEVSWISDDEETFWRVRAYIGPIGLDIIIKSVSSWLRLAAYTAVGIPVVTQKDTILNVIKDIQRWRIYFEPKAILALINKISEKLKKVGETLKFMWNSIKNDAKKAYDDANKIFGKYCFIKPCAPAAIWGALNGVLGGISGFFSSVFGSTKTETFKIGEDQFGCTIFRRLTKKCGPWPLKCRTIKTEDFSDKACLERVQRELLQAKYLEELANYKEEVVSISMAENLGYQYVMERLAAGEDILSLDDINIEDLIVDYNLKDSDLGIVRVPPVEHSYRFDPDDTSFFNGWETNFESFFNQSSNFSDNELTPPTLTRNLSVATTISVNATRLSSLFKKSPLKIEFKLPVNVDLRATNAEEQISLIGKMLEDPDGPLLDAIIGDNAGVSDLLKDTMGMQPPIISLDEARNPTIYCDDPTIDSSYGENAGETLKGLEKHLTPLRMEQVFKSCRSNIQYRNDAQCDPDETVCGATICFFDRYIYDGCGQESNHVRESVRILPRMPFFKEFPNNIIVSCDENISPIIDTTKTKIPNINSGCRNVEYNVEYEDVLLQSQCSHEIYRKWKTSIIGCEKSLYASRTQKIFVEDTVAPYFKTFPSDKEIEFLDAYGTLDSGYPKVYDSCGHGPSSVSYSDKIMKENNGGIRKIERTWTTSDKCGNIRNKTQNIVIKNRKNNYRFNNRALYSFNNITLESAVIAGKIASKNEVNLKNTIIGTFGAKSVNVNDMTVLAGNWIDQQNSFIVGSSISLNNEYVSLLNISYDFDQVKLISQQLANNLVGNKIKMVNNGPSRLLCKEDVVLERDPEEFIYPITNYIDSSCVIAANKEFSINNITTSGGTSNDVLNINGHEHLYNIFNLNNASYLNKKQIKIHAPDLSFVVINVFDEKPINLNDIKIEFTNKNLDSTCLLINFLKSTQITIGETIKEFHGTILAVNANIVNAFNLSNEKQVFSGQLIANNLKLKNFRQNSNLFEAIQD